MGVKEHFDVARLTGPDAKRTPEMEQLFAAIMEADKALPDLNAMSLQEARPWRVKQMERVNADPPAVKSVERVKIAGLNGAPDVVCDLITPQNAEPGGLIFLHGGGWAFGDLVTHSRLAKVLATETRKRTLYVDYRLAPETPFPGPLDDCVAAWRWLVAKGETDPHFRGPLSAAGDSAGGNLSIALALREMQAGKRIPNVILSFYGVMDDDVDTPSYTKFAIGYGLARPGMMKFWEAYAPSATFAKPRKDPLLCPAKASNEQLNKLPPIYLAAAGLDPLLCDTINMASRLEEAGATFDVNVHEGLHHGFIQQTARLSESRRALQLAMAFYWKHELG